MDAHKSSRTGDGTCPNNLALTSILLLHSLRQVLEEKKLRKAKVFLR